MTALPVLEGRIAVIGWGSLIWDIDNLAPYVSGEWMMRGGPALPMEFARVSPKRKMGLAVCLDAVHGDECATHAIQSVRDDILLAAEDLRARERATPEMIGYIHPASGAVQAATDQVADIFTEWCAVTGAAGAVWTDLNQNFREATGDVFSVPRAVDYLKTLRGESLEEAVRYIEFAPETTSTPLRRALAADEWWRAQAEIYARKS
ncbi:MAG: hypothetical protein ACPGGK_16215 [Pikeienuella sp.]